MRRVQGQLGDVIEATDGRAVPVSFSEGSTLLLHPGGRIRVLSLERDDARVLVEDGVVDATIAHRRGRHDEMGVRGGLRTT